MTMNNEVEEAFEPESENLIAFLEGRDPVKGERELPEIIKIDQQIAGLKANIEKLERQRFSIENGDIYAIADILHGRHCSANHTDNCGYNYETWGTFKKEGSSRRKIFYEKAEKLIKLSKETGISIKQALAFSEIVGK
jgi:hypothetical protein